VDEVARDGFSVDETVECLLSSDTDVGMAKTLGLATLGLADTLGRLRPDVLVVIADRYEMLAAAAVALTLRIPIAHIEGGDLSEGAIDDAVRNALTKLSHLHFTTTERARRRVLAMGEEPWRVHRVGALSLDHLTRGGLPAPAVVASRLQITPDDALGRLPHHVVLCFPNADAGSRSLIERARLFCASRPNASLVINLPAPEYWSLLSMADVLVGNSSSGVMEAASLHTPAINVGIRQEGREHAGNVLNVPADRDDILAALQRALAPEFQRIVDAVENPYGDGGAAERILEVLTTTPLDRVLLIKRAAPLVSES
jgi:UDP-N-acetylglucosamine 2-epimerase (non-hydrolysing)/GDP/UDP-N,N'-diacetylbacillosamine 2-epimerase (hydrolysing)